MFRIFVMVAIFVVHANCSADEFYTEPVKNKASREICGFKFMRQRDMSVTTKKISSDSLKNRVDNERYNACAYEVKLKIQNFEFDLGFGEDITLDRLKNWTNYFGLSAGFFRYDKDGWEASDENVKIEKSNISVKKLKGGVIVSGVALRINQGQESDYCFSFAAISKERYLTSWVCRPRKQDLQVIDDLFRNHVLISF